MKVRFQFNDRSQVNVELPQQPQQGSFISIDGITFYQIIRVEYLVITDQKEPALDSVICKCAYSKARRSYLENQ